MNIEEAKQLLTEIRQRLLFDVDENGEPRSSISELMSMWFKVNDFLNQ